jgi:phosphopantothenoylcysteine decarboxylase/phosphopantothenate--cysteine ligase
MNPAMWLHPATQRNVSRLVADGVEFIGPNDGEMAEPGEAGPGRLAEVAELVARIEEVLARSEAAHRHSSSGKSGAGRKGSDAEARPLTGRHVLVTSGPTQEPIDPVRFISNRSSGKQGHAIAAAASRLGARVTLVSGPVALPDPPGVTTRHVRTAREMLEAALAALPADVAVLAAAVADWRVASPQPAKLKRHAGSAAPLLELVENPDILRTLSARGASRPALVIGFAAETENVLAHAQAKRKAKGADWIVANDVSPGSGVIGGDRNAVHLVTASGVAAWPDMTKEEVAERLMAMAAEHLARTQLAI